jgi:hypothetical protein
LYYWKRPSSRTRRQLQTGRGLCNKFELILVATARHQ